MTPEDLYKNSFDGYQQDPPPGVWDRVNRQLATKSFLTPGLGHFNILYVAAAIVVAVFWASPDENQAPTQNGEDVTMADSASEYTLQPGGTIPSYNEKPKNICSNAT